MARVTNTLIGKSYGKVGGAVFSVWKGINVLKEKGIPSNPQTQDQMTQRLKMAMFVFVYQQLPQVFNIGFNEMAVKMSGFNAFIREAFAQAAWAGSYPTFTLDPSKLNVSKGSLTPTAISTAVADHSLGTVVVTWDNTPIGTQSTDDYAFVAVYNEDQATWAGESVAYRSDGTGSINLPASTAVADTLTVWLFFAQQVSYKGSNSDREQVTVVA